MFYFILNFARYVVYMQLIIADFLFTVEEDNWDNNIDMMIVYDRK